MAIINRTSSNKCWGGCRKKNVQTLWAEGKLVQSLWKTVWMFPQKLIRELSFDTAIPLMSLPSHIESIYSQI